MQSRISSLADLLFSSVTKLSHCVVVTMIKLVFLLAVVSVTLAEVTFGKLLLILACVFPLFASTLMRGILVMKLITE